MINLQSPSKAECKIYAGRLTFEIDYSSQAHAMQVYTVQLCVLKILFYFGVSLSLREILPNSELFDRALAGKISYFIVFQLMLSDERNPEPYILLS